MAKTCKRSATPRRQVEAVATSEPVAAEAIRRKNRILRRVFVLLDDYAEEASGQDDPAGWLAEKAIELYDRFIVPVDLPGPDVIWDNAIKAIFPILVRRLYEALDEWANEQAARS